MFYFYPPADREIKFLGILGGSPRRLSLIVTGGDTYSYKRALRRFPFPPPNALQIFVFFLSGVTSEENASPSQKEGAGGLNMKYQISFRFIRWEYVMSLFGFELHEFNCQNGKTKELNASFY